MKTFLFRFLSLTCCLLFLFGCSPKEPLSAVDEPVRPQLEMVGQPDVMCCAECPSGCLLGYEFSTDMNDQDHPQGAYLVKRIVGNCECVYTDDGTWTASVIGPASISTALWGGPGSLSACAHFVGGTLPFDLFGDACGYDWVQPNSDIPIEWGSWLTAYIDSLRGAIPQTVPIGSHSGPFANISTISPIAPTGTIRVAFQNQTAAQMLNEIRIYADADASGNNQLLASLPGNAAATYYDLDLSLLPPGSYQVQLHFPQNFYLSSTLQLTAD